jgi:hypothetical protein
VVGPEAEQEGGIRLGTFQRINQRRHALARAAQRIDINFKRKLQGTYLQ